MNDFLKKILGDKKAWREMEARAKALPRDYNIVYHEIQKYMWKFSGGDGMDIIPILKDLLGLFEEGVANSKSVLEITGEDVATFSDDLLKNANTYTENWHDALNREVMKKIERKKK